MKVDYSRQIYEDVLIEQRADPYVIEAMDGYYYFTASYPVCGRQEEDRGIGYDRLILRRAKTISELKNAKEVVIWHQKDSKKAYRYVWAPELHNILGKWYIFFAAGIEEGNVWSIRPHVLECMGEDLMDPNNWNTKDESNLHRVEAVEDKCTFAQMSLDMTYFNDCGKHYVVWADTQNKISGLYMGEIDGKNPWKLCTPSMRLSMPEYSWEESNGLRVNEGPAMLKHKDMLYLCYSAAAVDYSYCIGLLYAKSGSDLMDINSWTKCEAPLLTSDDFVTLCGPGHNSFTKDEEGNDILIYHGRPLNCSNANDKNGKFGHCEYAKEGEDALIDPCRHARVKRVWFDKEDRPVLNKTAGYLFVTFTTERENSEQVYFALSKDGLHWEDCNNSNPVLCSHIGEKGVRDPFIFKTNEDKYFIIATDLQIAVTKDWDVARTKGSHSIIIWESEDLINWSAPWSVEIALKEAGCTWAPEVVYDKEKDSYMVFFASFVPKDDLENGKHCIYRSYTKDFRKFSKPELYIERKADVIDTTIIEDNGLFYRFSKDETKGIINVDYSNSLDGEFTEIEVPALEQLKGVEGPVIFRLKDRSFCLLVDQYGTDGGYRPLRCKDLATGEFDLLSCDEYNMGKTKKRHGSILELTEEEYERLSHF